MRIGLNLLHAGSRIGGGWNYISNIVRALATVDQVNEYVAFANRESSQLVPPSKNFQLVKLNLEPHHRLRRVIFEQTALQRMATTHRLDLMHWFANTSALLNSVPPAVTIYDLLMFREVDKFSYFQGIYLRYMMRRASRGALLLPMSQATAEDLVFWLDTPLERMWVIPPPVPTEFQIPAPAHISDFRRKYGLPERFWLYVAHYYPHKNHKRLLEAYARLRSIAPDSWKLVLRGDEKSGSAIRADINRAGLDGMVLELGRLESVEMPLLYGAATALVYPSLFEGGGIPLLEAMACGCPVIASNIPTTREFGAQAVLEFNPADTDDIVGSMRQVQNNPALREELSRAGVTRATSYAARVIGHKLVAAYDSLHTRAINS